MSSGETHINHTDEIYPSLNVEQQENHLRAYGLAWAADGEHNMLLDSAIELADELSIASTSPEDMKATQGYFREDLQDFETFKRAAEVLMPPIDAYYPSES